MHVNEQGEDVEILCVSITIETQIAKQIEEQAKTEHCMIADIVKTAIREYYSRPSFRSLELRVSKLEKAINEKG